MERTYVGYAPNATPDMGNARDYQKSMQNSLGTLPPMGPIDERLNTLEKTLHMAQAAAIELENRFDRVLGSGPSEPNDSPPQIDVAITKMSFVDSLDRLIRVASRLNSHLVTINSRCQL